MYPVRGRIPVRLSEAEQTAAEGMADMTLGARARTVQARLAEVPGLLVGAPSDSPPVGRLLDGTRIWFGSEDGRAWAALVDRDDYLVYAPADDATQAVHLLTFRRGSAMAHMSSS